MKDDSYYGIPIKDEYIPKHASKHDYYSNYNEETGLIVANPIKDGDNLIYSVCDALDGYLVMYYKCAADGTILEVGVEHYEEE